MSDVHPAAAKGFGRDAETYVRGRPDFPADAFDWLRGELGLGAGRSAVDLGAGTGKFTRLLAETHAEVIAIEPSAAMLGRLAHDLPGVAALRGTAQAIPLGDATIDAVVCAQAFHWFASAAAVAEIRRILKPGGMLGLIWNIRDESVEWVRKLTDILAPYEGDAPRYYHGEWRKVFPAPGFGELHERVFRHEHVGPPEQVIVDRVASISFIAALDPAARSEVLDQVRALISATPQLGHPARFPYVTRAWSTRRA